MKRSKKRDALQGVNMKKLRIGKNDMLLVCVKSENFRWEAKVALSAFIKRNRLEDRVVFHSEDVEFSIVKK